MVTLMSLRAVNSLKKQFASQQGDEVLFQAVQLLVGDIEHHAHVVDFDDRFIHGSGTFYT